ncbi:hypothetical protein OHA37_27385 [Streptomyces sp. NBC_00335]|uniref:hypothetical protein n=1 Tax=unclassified Streptomyces TaxID=2593676 RepID=UPI00224F7570|nr:MULTISPECIES: hypothetical protein [unclassified Streptomyces]MCX5407573.1 hypothetical protein [Streptomyces sp. NBC_00086]
MNKLMTSLGIALAVTTAASGLGLGSVAHADDIRFPPRVIVVQSGGEFRIQLHNDESIDGTTTLRVRPKGGQTVAAEVGVGTWKCVATEDDHCFSSVAESAPVVLDEMGMYDLDIVLHKGAEDETVHRKDAWGFAYALNPRFTSLVSSTPVLSYERRGGKASGTLVAEHPRTHEVKPLADAPVDLTVRGHHLKERLTTDGAGRFATLFQFDGGEGDPGLDASFAPESGPYDDRAERALDLQVRATPAKLTIRQPTAGITGRYGSQVPVQGVVTWTASDGTVRPLAGMVVRLSNEGCAADHCSLLQRNSDAAGAFDLPYPVTRDGYARVELLPPGWNNGWFTGELSSRLAVDATHTTGFTPFSVSADKNRTITVAGQLALQQGSAPAGARATVDVQMSPDGKTGWKTVKSFTTAFGTTFSQQVKHTAAQDGHYVRLSYAGAADIGPTARVGRLTRKTTRIVGDNLAPEGIPAGTRINAGGTLQVKSGTAWLPLAGQRVRVYFKADATGSGWTYQGSATTAANGSFLTKVTTRQDGTWQIHYLDATDPYYAAIGREDHVDVV